jgi:hypothetical protein
LIRFSEKRGLVGNASALSTLLPSVRSIGHRKRLSPVQRPGLRKRLFGDAEVPAAEKEGINGVEDTETNQRGAQMLHPRLLPLPQEHHYLLRKMT